MEVIKVSEASKQLEKMLLERKERFQQILNQNADRFITLAINYAVKNPVIFQCDPKVYFVRRIRCSEIEP